MLLRHPGDVLFPRTKSSLLANQFELFVSLMSYINPIDDTGPNAVTLMLVFWDDG